MKKLVLLSAIAMSGMIYNTANAQFGLHIGVRLFPHIRSEVVVQAPVYQEPVQDANYDNSGDDYYYLPDIGAYYNVTENCYYYFDGDNWVSAAYLPGEYRYYDWRNARRYEIRERRAYLHDDVYRERFKGFHGDIAHNDRFRDRGFDDHFNHDAYNRQQNFDKGNRFDDHFNDHRNDNRQQNFDNRGNNGRVDNRNQGDFNRNNNGNDDRGGHQNNQDMGNRNQNRDNGNRNSQDANQHQNHDKGNQQQRFAQNAKPYDGHHTDRIARF